MISNIVWNDIRVIKTEEQNIEILNSIRAEGVIYFKTCLKLIYFKFDQPKILDSFFVEHLFVFDKIACVIILKIGKF